MRIRHVNFCVFRVSFCENQAEFRTSKTPLNITADRTLTIRIPGRSSMDDNAAGIALVFQGLTT
jgi:hypothetical protein